MKPGAIPFIAALTACAVSGTVLAADGDGALQSQLHRLAERMEQLEQRNLELERQVIALKNRHAAAEPTARAGAGPAVEQRLAVLENAQAQVDRALEIDRNSESEPPLASRLKAVEVETMAMRKQARQIEALEGIVVSASITTMAQRVNGAGSATGSSESRLNYRGDLSITLPVVTLGDAEGSLFANLRFGQGNGIGLRPSHVSTANTTTFEVGGVGDPDSSFAILAQAWYQLVMPLRLGGDKSGSTRRLVLNVGKIDPFVFFDQNAIADDETVKFVNNAFVHNPLLDSGGDVGADFYGFSPGVRLASM